MDENSDSSLVPSLTVVVENIYSTCDVEKNGQVPATDLIDYVRPLLANDPNVIDELIKILDPKNENPFVSRNSFYEAMGKWTSKINGSDHDIAEISFKEESFDKLYYSTNRQSLGLDDQLNFSGFSPKSYSSTFKTSTGNKVTKLLEDKVKELEHKYANAISELSMVKLQLASTEEQYAELKTDLERTNRRLVLEQQVNEDLQKSMEHRDDFSEEINHTKEEIDNLQKLLSTSKKENINLRDYIEELETEKEEIHKQLKESSRKEQQLREEYARIISAISARDEDIQSLQKLNEQFCEKLNEQNSFIEHITQISDMLKEDNKTLRTVARKNGYSDLKALPLMSPEISLLGTTPVRKNPSKPLPKILVNYDISLKNMYQPSFFEREKHKTVDILTRISNSLSPKKTSQFSNVTKRSLSPQFPRNQASTFEICGATRNSRFTHSILANRLKASQNTNLVSPDISTYPISEVLDDMDLSVSSDKAAYEGQNLLSELQACNYLEDREKCSVEEHEDWLKIVKEHENCSKIIEKYQKQIEDFSDTFKKVEDAHGDLFQRYKNMEKDAKLLQISLDENKTENKLLKEENLNLDKTNKELLNRIRVFEDEQIKYTECEKQYEIIKNEKDELIKDIESLRKENEALTETLNKMNSDLSELESLRAKTRELENEQEKNCREVENLSVKLEKCTKIGKLFIDEMKKRIIDQNTKIDLIKDFNSKFEPIVQELRNETEENQAKLLTLVSTINETNKSERNNKDDSTSTEGSETNLTSDTRIYKRKSFGRKSSYEKQQFMFNKMEEKIDTLESLLRIENQKVSNLEFQLNQLGFEKVKLVGENDSLMRELEATSYNLSLKNQMMEQLRDQYTSEMDELKESFEKEKELNELTLFESEMHARKIEETLNDRIKSMEKQIDDISKDKKNLEFLLEKAENKAVSLKKVLSELSETSQDKKVLGSLIIEKESMLNFNRQLLNKSNGALEDAEKKLEKCKNILLETADELFGSAKITFQTWKESLRLENQNWIKEMENVSKEDTSISEINEQNVEMIRHRLTLSSNLFKALAKKFEESASSKCEIPAKISKFTLKPSKLGAIHFGSTEILDKNRGDVRENEGEKVEETQKKNSDSDEPKYLKEDESITSWLERGSQNLSPQIVINPSNNSIRLRDVSSDVVRKLGNYPAITDGSSNENPRQKEPRRFIWKCSKFFIFFIVICLMLTFLMVFQMECVRNNGAFRACPLDFVISLKKTSPLL